MGHKGRLHPWIWMNFWENNFEQPLTDSPLLPFQLDICYFVKGLYNKLKLVPLPWVSSYLPVQAFAVRQCTLTTQSRCNNQAKKGSRDHSQISVQSHVIDLLGKTDLFGSDGHLHFVVRFWFIVLLHPHLFMRHIRYVSGFQSGPKVKWVQPTKLLKRWPRTRWQARWGSWGACWSGPGGRGGVPPSTAPRYGCTNT